MEMINDFANIAGTELALIDGATNTRQFANELRWNSAYYRLTQRLP
jgi:L-arabinose isomerase